MSTITIRKVSITDLDTDAVVNAANSDLWAGSGVCGAIFAAAGYEQLETACSAIGHCDTGCAVITPGFRLKSRWIIHAVGPVWEGGDHDEAMLLYSAYYRSLELAVENACATIGFPLISSGVFGYPAEQAWEIAIRACTDFIGRNDRIDIVFAVRSDRMMDLGMKMLREIGCDGTKES